MVVMSNILDSAGDYVQRDPRVAWICANMCSTLSEVRSSVTFWPI